jgi:protein-tyrosine-phosphatase
MNRILFLCTGNYYRSRFAEHLFNDRARSAGLAWEASSRALAIERGRDNVGPMSIHAVEALAERGVRVSTERLPLPCTVEDLLSADLTIAVQEAEHRPLLLALQKKAPPKRGKWRGERRGGRRPPPMILASRLDADRCGFRHGL